jgi:hypothetical protein
MRKVELSVGTEAVSSCNVYNQNIPRYDEVAEVGNNEQKRVLLTHTLLTCQI